jgi:hypothetical protein
MKIKVFAFIATFLGWLSISYGQSTIAQWTFENLAITNYSPNPAPSLNNSAGAVSIAALGMATYATPGVGTNGPDIVQGAGSDSSGSSSGGNGITNLTKIWRVRAQGAGNGWSSAAPVGAQGAQVSVDTTGFTNLQVGFDWYLTKQGEANLQLQYTVDGTTWSNIAVTIPAAQAGSSLTFVDNSGGADANSVAGFYVHCVATTGGQQWFTNLTATITNVAAANNPHFAIRMVNASTGVACVNGAGSALNNSSGNWRFDNIVVNGTPLPSTIVQWTFENLAITNYSPNPTPSLNNSLGSVSAAALGMAAYATPGLGTNDPDITQGASSDTSSAANGGNGITNLSKIWRVRAQGSGNGWSSAAPVGSQGVQFSVDTTGFTNIQVGFDWYLTKQGEANLQLQYTVDGGTTWSNQPITIPAAQSGTSLSFVDNTGGGDANSVQGYYVNCLPTTGGQQWFTNLTAVITNPLAANNPNFAVRMVNASTGASCVNGVGTALNNSSGNWRFDNIILIGTVSGHTLTPPTITPSTLATVDGPFTVTFVDNSNWRNALSGITVNGSLLANVAYSVSAGQIVFTPSLSHLLESSGSANISITATNYSADLVVQYIAPGAVARYLITTEPLAPTGNGGTLVTQPTLVIADQYGNPTTNSATVTATVGAGAWSFGPGSGTVQSTTNGTVTFTNLSATSIAEVPGATITFTATGSALGGLPFSVTNSSPFDLPAPRTSGFTPGNLAVLQEDIAANNSTFSILEVDANTPGQLSPVNTYPVSATGANAMRQSSSGSTGRMSDSDDGTLVCWSAFLDGSSATADETTIDPRGAGTLDASGAFVLQAQYTGLGDATANQTRSATTVDNLTWFMGDKGGVYTNDNTPANAYIPYSTGNPANVRSLKSFNGVVYALQQEGGTDPYSTVLAIVPAPSSGSQSLFPLEGFPTDGAVLDFYLIASGSNGTNIDTAYYIDGTNSSSGALYKYYFTGTIDPMTSQQVWASAGASWPTPNGGDGLCAVTNSGGGVDLYYTTGSGGTPGNSVVKVHDSAAWNQPINLTSTSVLYTAPSKATLKGIAFAPQVLPGAPMVATLTASNLTPVSATLDASVNPDGNQTAYWFQFGPTAGYGGVTPTNLLAAGSSPVLVTALLAGLTPDTTYHYRIVATNSVATSAGVDRTFTTLPVTPPAVAATLNVGGSLQLAFTNTPGLGFSVLATNDLTIPVTSWPVVGQATENPPGSGNYQFTDPSITNQLFYIIRQP